MAFCTNCGKQIENGVVCNECQDSGVKIPSAAAPAPAASPAPAPAAQADPSKASEQGKGMNATMESIQKNFKEGFGKMTSSSIFKYYQKRLFNTSAKQEDDNYQYSLYAIAAFYGMLVLTLMIRGMDILLGVGGILARLGGQSFGMDEAKFMVEGLKSMGGMFAGAVTSLTFYMVIAALIGAGLGLVFYKLDKEKTFKDFVCGYANRLVAAVLLLVVAFLISLILRTFSIGTGIPAMLFMLALFLNSMAGLTLALCEVHIGGNKRFYIYSVALIVQFILLIFVMKGMGGNMPSL